MNQFIRAITSAVPEERDRAFADVCREYPLAELLTRFQELDLFRRKSENLYERVRASLFLHAGYRYYLTGSSLYPLTGKIPTQGFDQLMKRNFEKAITLFIQAMQEQGPNSTLFSALAEGYHRLAFQILADQVRKSVRSSTGNQWMFRVGHAEEHPLRVRHELLQKEAGSILYPLLCEYTAVRLDLTHSGWSDIFFLGMDYPEGARVINISVDLGVYRRDQEIRPPLESYFRVINEPLLRLTSLDLNASRDIIQLEDLFNFGSDYLGLLKAAVIASGLIPPSFEGTSHALADILAALAGRGNGIELVTKVNDIPKGSRLAVSTNLLASMISVIMRATGQTKNLSGQLTEQERRLIASRAILGEWLGGSGGGWQDSGGIWNGIKAIEGALAVPGDPEYGISRGCLLPRHHVFSSGVLHPGFEKALTDSLILMHGGMASNVGPILEMVTERYLLRSSDEWKARLEANRIYDEVKAVLSTNDADRLASLTTHNFKGPLTAIIPWATNHYTETIIRRTEARLGQHYRGFLMLGGMSGGGMGMFVQPGELEKAKDIILSVLLETSEELSDSLPFAMKPLVYDFRINHHGSMATLLRGNQALMPATYYAHHIPLLVKAGNEAVRDIRKAEIELFSAGRDKNNEAYPILRSVVNSLFRFNPGIHSGDLLEQDKLAEEIKLQNGFDFVQHEQLRQDLQRGRIGLARNRMPAETTIEDVGLHEIEVFENWTSRAGNAESMIAGGQVASMCLAAGVGSRWTTGAGVIKAINPFVRIQGKHRDFLEIHLARTRKTAEKYKSSIPFIIATSYLTHQPILEKLQKEQNYGYPGPVMLSKGRSIGQRFIPMERDLRFLWEVMPQELLDENKQKVRDAVRAAMIGWAKEKGEGRDYTENMAHQRLSPLGHWYEFPNMVRNGTLARLLREHPAVKHVILHNVDTLGAGIAGEVLSFHEHSGNLLTFEVIPRRMEDHGGGLARVNGRLRLLEGLAQPHEDDELNLSYYNSLNCWINIDRFLALLGFSREEFLHKGEEEIATEIRKLARRLPTYVTVKDVKYRWGYAQEDVYPVAQVEKLWGDMSILPDVQCGYMAVPRMRGQQLKEVAQLDAWLKDGSREYIEGICDFSGLAHTL